MTKGLFGTLGRGWAPVGDGCVGMEDSFGYVVRIAPEAEGDVPLSYGLGRKRGVKRQVDVHRFGTRSLLSTLVDSGVASLNQKWRRSWT